MSKLAYLRFVEEFVRFKTLTGRSQRFALRWSDRLACLTDKTSGTSFDTHYVYHTAWAARLLAETRPAHHVDISSIVWFNAIVSAFIPVTFYDYRPANLNLSGLSTKAADVLALPFGDGSQASLSCMHVIEHVGLGRYGDRLDPDADLKAIAELKRVMAPGGLLLFVVPIAGVPKVMFNAHRIYSYDQIIGYFSGFELTTFALVPDNAADVGLVMPASKHHADAQTYGCGCFAFRRI